MENVHPLFVHFPIALLIAALGVELLALLLGRAAWHRISLWDTALGAVGAAAAVFTGRMAEETAKHSYEIGQIMERHEKLGYVVLALALAVAGVRLFSRDRLSKGVRWLLCAGLAAACAAVAFGAHLGGRMVYEYGVGGRYGRSSGIEVVR